MKKHKNIRLKLPLGIKIAVITDCFSIIGHIVQWIFLLVSTDQHTNYEINISWSGNKSAIGEWAQYFDITNEEPTEAKEMKDEIIDADKGKILGFFGYRNANKYDEARNNIHWDISRLFSNEKMDALRTKLTQVIDIKKIEIEGEVGNSERLSYTKNVIYLDYKYEGRYYEEVWFMKVIRNKKDKSQHHIKEIRCKKWDWPLCKYFSQ